jgi:CRISPR-associated endonuclease/helicase Cas3
VKFYAHTADGENGEALPESTGKWQPLAEHLCNVAALAKKFAAPLGLPEEAELAGLLHDLGKYHPDFQQYLRRGRPRTPHAATGAAVIAARSVRLANIIASHHAGMNDWPELQPKLAALVAEKKSLFGEFLRHFQSELGCQPPTVPAPIEVGAAARELATRLVFSALVDADYLDTEEHFQKSKGQPVSEPRWPPVEELCAKLEHRMEDLGRQPNARSLNILRTQISDRCAEVGGSHPAGVFTLAVPTGGGKTLASARFALRHATRNACKRIIYVIPYTSIIEQNAGVFADIFGPNAVLEHHSLARWQEEDDETLDSVAQQMKRASENWEAPFIVTTNVQFFESLFSHRPAACRKLHRLMEAVIIFDECQTFPPELLTPTLECLKALLAFGKTSLVFCTATQPSLGVRPGFPEGFPNVTEIIPPEWRLHDRLEFRRTRLRTRREPRSVSDLCRELSQCARGLVIVNTRQQAWELFQKVRSEGVFHLSTLMCPAHRELVLNAVRVRLQAKNTRCLVISTQLVEAGVDLDFPVVYRALGPLDSIIQAAGRCNREGRLRGEDDAPQLGEVIVFKLEDHRLPPASTYRRATELASGTDFLPDALEGNFSPETIRRYFESLYNLTERDKHNLAQLSHDECYRQIGEKYRWIESDTEPVLTDYSPIGASWQAVFSANEFVPPTRQQWRAIGRYCINLPRSQVEDSLTKEPKLRRLRSKLVITQSGSYHPETGYNHFGQVPVDLLIF